MSEEYTKLMHIKEFIDGIKSNLEKRIIEFGKEPVWCFEDIQFRDGYVSGIRKVLWEIEYDYNRLLNKELEDLLKEQKEKEE